MSKKKKYDPAYLREQGSRKKYEFQDKKISFSLLLLDTSQGQSVPEWEEAGLMSVLFIRIKFLCQFTVAEALCHEYIKQYNKVDFPPNSKFKKPKHILGKKWAVMHITANSIEVIVGYIESDVFYIVYLDRNHHFWPLSD